MTYDLPVTIVVGLAMAVLDVIWLWREASRPTLVNRQEDTLTKQHERMERMQRDIDELRRTMADNHDAYEEELGELRAVLDEWWHGMKLVFEQMEQAQLIPVWQPTKPVPRKRKTAEKPSSTLAERIARQFNMEEIASLALDVGVLAEEFGGATAQARARELVELAYRRGITAALVARVGELRGKE